MKWVELQVYPDILELPFRGTPACGLPVLHGCIGNSCPLSVSQPRLHQQGHWRALCLGSWGPVQLGPAEEGEQPEAGRRLALSWDPNKPGPLGPRLTRQFRNGSFWGMVLIFHTSPASKLGLSLFGRGFEKRHAWGGRSLAGFNHLVFGSGHLVCRGASWQKWSSIKSCSQEETVSFTGRYLVLTTRPGARPMPGKQLGTGTPCFWDSVLEAVSQDCCKLKAKIEAGNLSALSKTVHP